MKKYICIGGIGVIISIGCGIMAAQASVHTSGGDVVGAGGSVAFSVGQVAYTHVNDDGGSVSLGVQQAYKAMMVGTDRPATDISFTVYPNPFHASIQIRGKASDSKAFGGAYFVSVFDMNGHRLVHQKIDVEETSIPFGKYSDAGYLLQIHRNELLLETFTLVKTQ